MQAPRVEPNGILSTFLPMARTATPSLDPQGKTDPVPFGVLLFAASVPLGRLLANGLSAANLSVQVAHDVICGHEQFDKPQTQLIILDLDMPDIDGPSYIRSLRGGRPDIRILVLSARSGIEDMVSALDNGADDYLEKPFSLLAFMARVRALCRRTAGFAKDARPKSASVVLHREQCRVERDGRFIELTPREFTLLEYLVENAGKTLSRAVLTQKVWNMAAEASTNIVDVYIKYLRDKLDGDHDVKLIRTIRGMGYSYQAQA